MMVTLLPHLTVLNGVSLPAMPANNVVAFPSSVVQRWQQALKQSLQHPAAAELPLLALAHEAPEALAPLACEALAANSPLPLPAQATVAMVLLRLAAHHAPTVRCALASVQRPSPALALLAHQLG
jgi:hypothetical protein